MPRINARLGVFVTGAVLFILLVCKFVPASPVNLNSVWERPPRIPYENGVPYDRANATFVTVVRSKDLWEHLVLTIRDVEDRFNRNYHYDWVFMTDGEFDPEFVKVTSALTSGEVTYVTIPTAEWTFPDWIDKEEVFQGRQKLAGKHALPSDVGSRQHLSRFLAGFLWRQPELEKYRYFWRIDSDVKLHCDIDYDVFKFMEENGKKVGFAVTLFDYVDHIPSLWAKTKLFLEEFPHYKNGDSLMSFISDDDGEHYNRCKFWTNFEIGDLDFWRSKAYRDYFDYLDREGGFYYEMWGDGPIHTIAASLFLSKDEIHYFDDVGYYHTPFNSCPLDEQVRLKKRCACDPVNHFAHKDFSCLPQYYRSKNLDKNGNPLKG